MKNGRNSSPIHAATLAFALLVGQLAACGGQQVTLPPVTPEPTGLQRLGKFVWYDLVTHDLEAAKRFYGELLGWQFQSNVDGGDLYTVVTRAGAPIAGIVYAERLEREVSRSRWVSYLSVADVDAAVDYVREGGGEVITGPGELPDRGRYAVVGDPQGAILALLRASGGDPSDRPGRLSDLDFQRGEWMWTELWTHDVEAAASFYQTLVGYEHDAIAGSDGDSYHVMKRDERPRAGILKLPWPEVTPNWLPYVVVDDLAEAIRRTSELGGRVLVAPRDENDRQMAIIADPSGAALNIQEWPPERLDEVEGR